MARVNANPKEGNTAAPGGGGNRSRTNAESPNPRQHPSDGNSDSILEPKLDMASAADRLAASEADLQRFRDEWEALGRPSMTEGSTGQLVPHSYVKLIRDAERVIVALSGSAAVKNKGGRPPGTQSAPDRRPPPKRTPFRLEQG